MPGFIAAKSSSSPARANGQKCAQQNQTKRETGDSNNHSQARNSLLIEHLGLEPPASRVESSRARGASTPKGTALLGQTTIPQKRKQNAAAIKDDRITRKRSKADKEVNQPIDDNFNVAKPGAAKTVQQAQHDTGSSDLPQSSSRRHEPNQTVAGSSGPDLSLLAGARYRLSHLRCSSGIPGITPQVPETSATVPGKISSSSQDKLSFFHDESTAVRKAPANTSVQGRSAKSLVARSSHGPEADQILEDAKEGDAWMFDEMTLSDVELEQVELRTECEVTQAKYVAESIKPGDPTQPGDQRQADFPELQAPISYTASRPPAKEIPSVDSQQQGWEDSTISSSPCLNARQDDADLTEVGDLDDQDFIAVEASLKGPAAAASSVPKAPISSMLVSVTKPHLPTSRHPERSGAKVSPPTQTAIAIYEDVDDYDEDDDQILASLLPHFPSASAPPSRPSSPTKPTTPLRPSRIDCTPMESTDLTDIEFSSTATVPSAACSQPYRPLTLSGRQASSHPYHWSLTAPIVRPAFPKPVNDRSHILGISSSTLLRTCFRLREALMVGCNAARHGQNMIIELYARVASSYREIEGTRQTGKQFFMLRDVYHEHPPYLQAVFEGWKGVQLLDDDAAAFLACGGEDEREIEDADAGVGKLCRAVGRMRREGKSSVFVMSSVWEAGWEDVEAVQQIVCS